MNKYHFVNFFSVVILLHKVLYQLCMKWWMEWHTNIG